MSKQNKSGWPRWLIYNLKNLIRTADSVNVFDNIIQL